MHEIHLQPAPGADFRQVKCVEGFDNIRAEYPVYLTDESKLSPKSFDYLFFPKTEAELAAVVREMGRRKASITLNRRIRRCGSARRGYRRLQRLFVHVFCGAAPHHAGAKSRSA